MDNNFDLLGTIRVNDPIVEEIFYIKTQMPRANSHTISKCKVHPLNTLDKLAIDAELLQ